MTTKIRFALVWAGPLLVVLCFDGRLAGETPLTEIEQELCVSRSTVDDCFRLWNACRPLYLVVEDLNKHAEEIGLTKERIQTAAESRLRAARLYDAEAADHYLYVNVTVARRAFSTRVGYNKLLHDEALGIGGRAETWNTGSTGTHGGDAGYILQDVSEKIDRFVVEYLRVNESACAGP